MNNQPILPKIICLMALNIFSAGILKAAAISTPPVKLKLIHAFRGLKGYLSADGSKIALLGNDGASVGSVKTGKIICHYDIPDLLNVTDSPISPDGTLIVVAYVNKGIRGQNFFPQQLDIVRASDCQKIKTIDTKQSPSFSQVTFSSDSRRFAFVAGEVQLWDLKTITKIYAAPIPEGYEPAKALLSPDGKWLAAFYRKNVKNSEGVSVAYGQIVVTDVQTGEARRISDEVIDNFEFSPNSKFLITNSQSDYARCCHTMRGFKTYEAGDWKLTPFIRQNLMTTVFTVSPDNKLIAVGSSENFYLCSLPGVDQCIKETYYKRTWLDDAERVPTFITSLNRLEFSGDGKMLAVSGEEGSTKLWSISW